MEYKVSKSITREQLNNLGFKYDRDKYKAIFPIYYYIKDNIKTPIIFLQIYIYLDDYTYKFEVIKKNGLAYATYYNQDFGNSKEYIKKLNKNINYVFNKLSNKNVFDKIKDKNKKNEKDINMSNTLKNNKIRGFKVVKKDMRKTEGRLILPTRGSSKAMAYDFYANDKYEIKPGEIAKIWTDVKAYMQDNECLIINVRSSMGGKFMLANTSGWIDADYYSNKDNDGNIGVFLKNISNEIQVINKGDRIAQGAFFNFLVADNGNSNKTRKGGFGSTGA